MCMKGRGVSGAVDSSVSGYSHDELEWEGVYVAKYRLDSCFSSSARDTPVNHGLCVAMFLY